MRGLLRQDRKEILDHIGFVWKVSSRKGELPTPEGEEALFMYRFRELIEHHKTFGIFPEGQHGEIGKWAKEQKALMETGKLDDMKAMRFAAIGFCTAGEERIWDENYAKLLQKGYSSIFSLEDLKLSHWVICQYYLTKKGRLPTERKMKFFEIPGFQWDSTPINLPQPELKHVMNQKAKKKPATKVEKKVQEEDPATTSSESEEDDGIETAKGNYVGLLAIASEWKADKHVSK